MVTRVTDAADRRSARVRITPAGERAARTHPHAEERLPHPPPGRARAPTSRPRAAELVDAARAPGGPVRRLSARPAAGPSAPSRSGTTACTSPGRSSRSRAPGCRRWPRPTSFCSPLHGTGVDVAIATGLQFLPLLLLGPFGGLIADRLDKRKVLYATQAAAGCWRSSSASCASPTRSTCGRSSCSPPLLGVVNLFDNPARQTFVSEMVGATSCPTR